MRIVSLATLSLAVWASSVVAQTIDKQATWVTKNYRQVYERIVAAHAPQSVTSRGRYAVGIVWSGPSEPESILYVEQPFEGPPSGVLVEARPSIQVQLESLYAEHGAETSDELAQRIVVRQASLSGKECPAIQSTLNRLMGIRVPLRLPEAMALDSGAVDLRITAASGNVLQLSLARTGTASVVIGDVQRLLEAARSCASASTAPANPRR